MLNLTDPAYVQHCSFIAAATGRSTSGTAATRGGHFVLRGSSVLLRRFPRRAAIPPRLLLVRLCVLRRHLLHHACGSRLHHGVLNASIAEVMHVFFETPVLQTDFLIFLHGVLLLLCRQVLLEFIMLCLIVMPPRILASSGVHQFPSLVFHVKFWFLSGLLRLPLSVYLAIHVMPPKSCVAGSSAASAISCPTGSTAYTIVAGTTRSASRGCRQTIVMPVPVVAALGTAGRSSLLASSFKVILLISVLACLIPISLTMENRLSHRGF